MSTFSENFDADYASTFIDFEDPAVLNIGTAQYPISVIASSVAEIVTDEQGRKKSTVAGRHFRFILPDGVSSFNITLEHDFITYNGETWHFADLVEGQSVGSKIVKYRAERGRIINIGKDHTQK